MKKLPFLVIVILVFASFAATQTSDKYEFGDRQIVIPAPDGFTSVYGRFPRIAARFNATEDPGNDLLAGHVPESFIPKLQASEDIDLGFYTKVFTLKKQRTIDVTDEFYKLVVAELEKNFGAYVDPNSETMKKFIKNSEKGLADIGSTTAINVTSSKNLGSFEKTDRVFSGMLVVVMEIYGRKLITLGTFSFMHINQRVVTVSVYKQFPSDNDLKDLPAFTKKWTAKILAANK